MAKNFPHEAQKTPNRINTLKKRKRTKTKTKIPTQTAENQTEKIMKEARRRCGNILSREEQRKELTADFSSETMSARKE